ncbi:MAG: hypothetical protein IPN94_08575 [Sphingobacteriales bacterium]|nr:hypothetical protein [Sphingobacteriales bacterium]
MQNNQDIYTLSPTEEAMLLNIANSRTATAHKAQAWLYAAKGYEFEITDGDIKLEDWTGISTSFKTNATPNTPGVLYHTLYTNPPSKQSLSIKILQAVPFTKQHYPRRRLPHKHQPWAVYF